MKFVKFSFVGLILAILTGCGTTTLSFGPSAKNPNSYGVFQFSQPAPVGVTVMEEEAGGTYPFRYSCQPEHTLGYELLTNEEGKQIRRWLCKTPEGFRTAVRTLVTQGGYLGGSSAVPGKATDPGCPYGMVYAPTIPGHRRTCH